MSYNKDRIHKLPCKQVNISLSIPRHTGFDTRFVTSQVQISLHVQETGVPRTFNYSFFSVFDNFYTLSTV